MKTAIITGASSGIGKSIAKTLSQKGFNLLLVARNEEKLKSLCNELPNSQYFLCDLTDKEQIQSLFKKLEPHIENLTALVNNAGAYKQASMEKDSDSVWEFHIEANLMSAIRLTRLLWPTLKKNKAHIVNISSTLAIRPILNTVAYSAIKAAMNNWTLSLALEGAADGITANCICPGLIDTPIHGFHDSKTPEDMDLKKSLQKIQPLGRIGQPEDIANTVAHLCSDEASWITGTVLNIDGGILLNS